MNVAMEQTEEYQDGQLKAKYGDAFLRGNNGANLCEFAAFSLKIAKFSFDFRCSHCFHHGLWPDSHVHFDAKAKNSVRRQVNARMRGLAFIL